MTNSVVQQQLLFDYSALDVQIRDGVMSRAVEIKQWAAKTAQGVVEIGRLLAEQKKVLGHGHFLNWVEMELGWTDRTVRNFMSVASRFKSENFSDLQIGTSALYLLSAPSTPEQAVAEAIDRAQSPGGLSHKDAKEIVQKHKGVSIAPTVDNVPSLQVKERKDEVDPNDRTWVPPEKARYVDGCGDDPTGEGQDEDTQQAATTPAVFSSASDQWYTPEAVILAARNTMGRIDLDPASCEQANENVRASRFFTAEDNGLVQKWGGNVWLNPPYGLNEDKKSNQALWSSAFFDRYERGEFQTGILLVTCCPDRSWFSRFWDYPLCIFSSRLKFWAPEGQPNQPVDANVAAYCGSNPEVFAEHFRQFGRIIVPRGTFSEVAA